MTITGLDWQSDGNEEAELMPIDSGLMRVGYRPTMRERKSMPSLLYDPQLGNIQSQSAFDVYLQIKNLHLDWQFCLSEEGQTSLGKH